MQFHKDVTDSVGADENINQKSHVSDSIENSSDEAEYASVQAQEDVVAEIQNHESETGFPAFNPVVEQDIRQISRFWGDENDGDQDDHGDEHGSEGSSSFTPLLSKSKKQNLRRLNRKIQ